MTPYENGKLGHKPSLNVICLIVERVLNLFFFTHTLDQECKFTRGNKVC